MKKVRILLAISDDLEIERRYFSDLILRLNKLFKKRNLQFRISHWNHTADSNEDYPDSLRNAELCLMIYRKIFNKNTRSCLEQAYNILAESQSGNPHKIYTFFKNIENTPSEIELFKASFEKEFGHYYCHFDNIDTLSLHFILQFEDYNNNLKSDNIIKIDNGSLFIDGTAISNVSTIPFISNNPSYTSMQSEIDSLTLEILNLDNSIREFDDKENIQARLKMEEARNKKLEKLEKTKKMFNKHQENLLNMARKIVQISNQLMSELLKEAIELFNAGEVEKANDKLKESLLIEEQKRQHDSYKRTIKTLRDGHSDLIEIEAGINTNYISWTAKADLCLTLAGQEEEEGKRKDCIDMANRAYVAAFKDIKLLSYIANKTGKNIEKVRLTLLNFYSKYTAFLQEYEFHSKYYLKNALKHSLKALKIREKATKLKENSIELADNLFQIASIHYNLSQYKEALAKFKGTLEIQLKYLEKDDFKIAETYNKIAFVYSRLALYKESLYNNEKALHICELKYDLEDPRTLHTQSAIAMTHLRLGNYNTALEYYKRIYRVRQAVLSQNHPLTVISCNYVGLSYYHMGMYDKALEYQKQTLAINTNVIYRQHAAYIWGLNHLGKTYTSLGYYQQALAMHEEVLKEYKKRTAENTLSIGLTHSNIGMIYKHNNQYREALKHFLVDLDIAKKNFGSNHPDTAWAYNNIALIYRKLKFYRYALDQHLLVLDIRKNAYPSNHPDIAISHNDIGKVYYAMGDYKNSLIEYEKSLKIRNNTPMQYHPANAITHSNMGDSYFKENDFWGAVYHYKKALAIRETVFSNHAHPDLTRTYHSLTQAYQNLDRLEEASFYASKHKKMMKLCESKIQLDTSLESDKDFLASVQPWAKTIQNINNSLNTIKIFIASSLIELEQERLEFSDLTLLVNEFLEQFQIEIELEKCEFCDSSMSKASVKQEEYNDVLRKCSICLVLFAQHLGEKTKEELNVAIATKKQKNQSLKDVIVWCKSNREKSAELALFEGEFLANYDFSYECFDSLHECRYKFLELIVNHLNSLDLDLNLAICNTNKSLMNGSQQVASFKELGFHY